MKLQFVISKYQGEKKISSVPYVLSVNIGGPRAGLRMGAQVPYATTQVSDGVKTPSYSYRDVGVGIDVTNQMLLESGLYKIDVVVEDTSISSSNQVQGAPVDQRGACIPNVSEPTIRSCSERANRHN